jgi:aryl-alcohol dehydrogenase-like predicted oxidoreductase
LKQQALGDSGVRVSRVGLGCNNFGRLIGKEEARAVVDAALDSGITFFDTAYSYGGGASETFLGELLQHRRDEVVLGTKFGAKSEDGGGLAKGSREYMRLRLAESLERLRTDYLDVYYLHFADPETPLAETLEAMQELVAEGTVRAIGCSNFDAGQLAEAEGAARTSGKPHFSALQNKLNLLEREAERTTLPLAHEYGVGFVPYFPLASGLLTGKYERGRPAPPGTRLADWQLPTPAEPWERIDALAGFAQERGRTLLELAIAGLASMPGVSSVIAGARTPEQVRDNAAAGEWELDASDLASLANL